MGRVLDFCWEGGGDVGAELLIFKIDEISGGVGALAGLFNCWGGGGDGEDSAAVGVEVTFGDFCGGVVDVDTFDFFCLVEACDDIADSWALWVAIRGEDHGDGVVVREANIDFVEGSCSGCG